ncbi:hypothetical protein J2797_005146 [Paraburkholderia terricola]|nr:hypothetical protein [Paraburkholderia terricola]
MTHARAARFIHRFNETRTGCERPSGICEEAFASVAAQTLPKRTVAALARMASVRQIAAIRIMVAVDNLSGDFARALLAATPSSQRSDDARGRQSHPDCVDQLARIERGLVQMQREAAELRLHHGDNLVHLVLAASVVRDWMMNEVVTTWLHSHYPESAIVLQRLANAADFAVEPGRPMKLPYSMARRPSDLRRRKVRVRSGAGTGTRQDHRIPASRVKQC